MNEKNEQIAVWQDKERDMLKHPHIIKNVSSEDGMKIAEQYGVYEAKITEQQKQLEEIYELLVGTNGIKRYTHKELIESIKANDELISKALFINSTPM